MSLEARIFAALSALVSGRVFPDIAPEGVAKPYITYQQVGGDAVNYVEAAVPDTQNARVQINVWALTRVEASALGEQAENVLRLLTDVQTTVLGARVSVHEADTNLRGARQDFSIWY